MEKPAESAGASLVLKLGCAHSEKVLLLGLKVKDPKTGVEFTPSQLVPRPIGASDPGSYQATAASGGMQTEDFLFSFILCLELVQIEGGTVVCQQAPPPAPPGTMICTVIPGAGSAS